MVTSITAVLTSFNRKAFTIKCLEHLERSAQEAKVALDAVLVDDGSGDGTAQAVVGRFQWVTVVHGDGALYWNRGMHRALATECGESEFVLWVNDDTFVSEDAVGRLVAAHRSLLGVCDKPPIIVGAATDDATGQLTYGGFKSAGRLRRFSYRKVWNADHAEECEAMNGNLVLLPRSVVREIGNLDPKFEHAMGDIDYALRCREAGFRIFVAPGVVAHCAGNSQSGTYRDASLPFNVRWKKMMSRKGLPPRSWWHFTRRHGGVLAPVYFVWPYARVVCSALTRVGRRKGVNE